MDAMNTESRICIQMFEHDAAKTSRLVNNLEVFLIDFNF